MYLPLLPTHTEKPKTESSRPKVNLQSTSMPTGALYTLPVRQDNGKAASAKCWQPFAYKDIQVYVYCAAAY